MDDEVINKHSSAETSSNNPPSLDWRNRSQELNQAIDTIFDIVVSNGLEGYQSVNQSQYTFGTMKHYYDTSVRGTEVIQARGAEVLKNNQQSLNVLDIGAGGGAFLSNYSNEQLKKHSGYDVKGYGLTAHDLRKEKNPLNFDYRIGNADKLASIYPPNSFDAIVSNYTVYELTDPVGAIQQMYESLKPNGVMIIDYVGMPGIEGRQLPQIVQDLNKNGYKVAATYSYELVNNEFIPKAISTLAIRKTKDTLNLPLKYGPIVEGHASYSVTKELEETSLKLPQSLLEVRRKILIAHPDWDSSVVNDMLLHVTKIGGFGWARKEAKWLAEAGSVKDLSLEEHLKAIDDAEKLYYDPKNLRADLNNVLGLSVSKTGE